MRFWIAAHLSRSAFGQRRCRARRQASRFRGRQCRLPQCPAASEPGDRRQGDRQRASQRRLRRRRGHQPHPRQDDRKTARLRQEGGRRRRRRVLLCRPRHRREQHQLPAADRRRPEVRDGRQAWRRHQCRPHPRADHGRRQGQAGVPRRLPRQSVRRPHPFRQGDPQRRRQLRPCRDEVGRGHAARLRHRPRPDRARRRRRQPLAVHPRADLQHCQARRRDPAGDDQGSRPGQRGDQQEPAALGSHQPDRRSLSQPAGRIRRQACRLPPTRLPRPPSLQSLRPRLRARWKSSSGAR